MRTLCDKAHPTVRSIYAAEWCADELNAALYRARYGKRRTLRDGRTVRVGGLHQFTDCEELLSLFVAHLWQEYVAERERGTSAEIAKPRAICRAIGRVKSGRRFDRSSLATQYVDSRDPIDARRRAAIDNEFYASVALGLPVEHTALFPVARRLLGGIEPIDSGIVCQTCAALERYERFAEPVTSAERLLIAWRDVTRYRPITYSIPDEKRNRLTFGPDDRSPCWDWYRLERYAERVAALQPIGVVVAQAVYDGLCVRRQSTVENREGREYWNGLYVGISRSLGVQ